MTQFGEVPGDAIERPGAYAVVFGPEGAIAFVRTPVGTYLPGGGADPGETLEETLHREIAEETGLIVAIEHHLGVVRQVVERHRKPAWNKVCTYFQCTLRGTTRKVEDDHELVWIAREYAARAARLPCDRWAIERIVE